MSDLRAKVRAMYDDVLERHTDPNGSIMTEYEDGEFNGALEALKDVLALLDEEYMPRSRSDAPAGRATKSLFDEEATP